MILIILLFSYSLSSLIFKKVLLDEYKKELITKNIKSITKLYDFQELTFESFNFKFNNNIYQIANITKKNIIYNINAIDISINEKNNSIDFFQNTLNPFLNLEIEFKLINLDTSESNYGKFNMISENITIQKIYQSNPEIKGNTFIKLSIKDLSDLPIDKNFIEEILKFFCYSQEKKISNLFNINAVQKYFNDEMKSEEIKIQLNTPSKKNNTIKLFQNSSPKILSEKLIQIPLSGSVNNKKLDPLIDPQFTTKEENLFCMHKDIFYNLINDNLYNFNITDDNNIEIEYKLSMKYLKLIIPDFKYLYPDSMNLIAINKMVKFVPYNDQKNIFGMLFIETEINSIIGDLNILKFNQVLNISINTQYISNEFNLQISSIKINNITFLIQNVRIQNKQLLIKWINNSYSKFLLKKGSKFFLNGINMLKENLIDYSAILKTDENWIKFLDTSKNRYNIFNRIYKSKSIK